MEEQEKDAGLSPADEGEVLDTAMEAGHILLENGAEIFRVEDTMRRLAKNFGVETEHFFVLSNGIFTTGDCGGERGRGWFAKVQHIPVKGARLDKVVAVNQLSREVEKGQYTIAEVRARLREIREMPGKPRALQILAAGVGSACFCFLFGGSFRDSAAAFVAGALLYAFVLFACMPHLSKIIGNVCSGGFVTVICILCCRLGLGEHLGYVIIGSIIPLVPGVPFTNGIRDIADGDYISGAVRLMDAVMVLTCVAIGVCIVFSLYHRMFGGVILL